MSKLYELKSKAQYISDLALAMMAGCIRAEMPQNIIDECFQKLNDVAETLEEYHDYGEED